MAYDHAREFTRSPTDLFAELQVETGETLRGRARDASLRGVFIECDAQLPVHKACHIALLLERGPRDTLRIEAEGRVARCTKDGIAVEITKLGSQSYQHLRNLVLYNANDPEAVEDEFEAHIGLHRRS